MPSKPPIFRPAHLGTAQQGRQAYERERGSARERGYTPTWDKAARHYRNLHPLCLGCQANGRVTIAEVVDHTVPHKGNQELFWAEANWQSSCTPHHSIVKQILEDLYAQGKATAADLRLDSKLAIELTHRLLA